MDQFTVLLLDKPKDPVVIDKLVKGLRLAFKLPEAQARALANKPQGPLLKPTNEARAQQVANLYTSLGIPVKLVNLAEGGAETVDIRPLALQEEQVEVKPRTIETPPPEPPISQNVSVLVSTVVPVGQPQTPTPNLPPTRQTIKAPSNTPSPSTPTNLNTIPSLSSENVPMVTTTTPNTLSSFEPEPPTLQPSAVEVNTSAAVRPKQKLQNRLVLNTLAPLILFSLIMVPFVLLSLPRALDSYVRNSAHALAISIATTMDLWDPGTLAPELDLLMQRPEIGYISVYSVDTQTAVFRAKNAQSINAGVNTALNLQLNSTNTRNTIWKDSPEAYTQLKQLLVGKNDNPTAIQDIDAALANTSSRKVTSYQIEHIGVVQDQRQRKVLGVNDKVVLSTREEHGPNFIITVGLTSNPSATLITNQSIVLGILAFVMLAIAAFIATLTSNRISAPILDLIKSANEISLGKLDQPLIAQRNDEIGDLSRSLERMRISLSAAIDRLRRRRR